MYTPPHQPLPVEPGPLRPSRLWYLVAAVVFVGLPAIGVALIAQLFSGLNAPLDELTPGQAQPVTLRTEGLTVFADQASNGIECTATDHTGAPVTLERPGGELTISSGGVKWEMLYRTPEPVPAGDYTVTCQFDSEADSTDLVAGKYVSVANVVGTIFLAIGLGIVGVVAGLVIGIVTLVKRSRNNKRRRQNPYGDPTWF